MSEDGLKKIISHAKEYGFVFPSSEIYDGLSAGDGPMAKRRIFTICYHLTRHLGFVDVGHYNTLSSTIKNSCGVEMLKTWDPHDRRDPSVLCRDADLHGGIDAHRVVFHVDE